MSTEYQIIERHVATLAEARLLRLIRSAAGDVARAVTEVEVATRKMSEALAVGSVGAYSIHPQPWADLTASRERLATLVQSVGWVSEDPAVAEIVTEIIKIESAGTGVVHVRVREED